MGPIFSKLRKRLGWSQRQLGEALGVSQPTIWRIEHNLTQPSKSVQKLLHLLIEETAA